MGTRLVGEVTDRNQAGILWTVTEILSGLRYEKEIIQLVMQKVMNMIDLEDSSTYRARIAKGQAKVLREIIKSLGESLIGPTDEASLSALEKIEDVDILKAIANQLPTAATWDQLFEN